MSVAASRPSPLVAGPAPVAAPTPADREPAPHPFSELLRQNRAVERARSEAPKGATPPVAAGAEQRLHDEQASRAAWLRFAEAKSRSSAI